MCRQLARVTWGLLLWSVCAGCWRGNVPDPDLSQAEPRVLALQNSRAPGEVRAAILAAMDKRRWSTEREADREIIARLGKKGVTVRLSLAYSGDRITIVGLSALGGGRSYEKWLSNLEESIRAELKEPAVEGPMAAWAEPGAPRVDPPKPVAVVAPVAPPEPVLPQVDEVTGLPLTWANRASFFIGARGGLAVPPDAVGFAPSGAVEFGVAAPTGFGFGLRGLFMTNPPGVPFLGIPAAVYGVGALADFRYYFETADPLIVYPTISAGFLAGPAQVTLANAAMPLFNLGVGVKVRFGNVYATFEFGVSGFTIPFITLNLNYEADSKLTKAQRQASERPAPPSAALAPTVVTPAVVPQPTLAAPP